MSHVTENVKSAIRLAGNLENKRLRAYNIFLPCTLLGTEDEATNTFG